MVVPGTPTNGDDGAHRTRSDPRRGGVGASTSAAAAKVDAEGSGRGRVFKKLFRQASEKVKVGVSIKLGIKSLKNKRLEEERRKEEEANREIEEAMQKRLRLALLLETGARRAKRRRIAHLLAKALVRTAVERLPVAESLSEWRAVLRTTRKEAIFRDDSNHTHEDREDAMRRLWVYSADPMGKLAFDDEALLEVLMRLLLKGAADRDVLFRHKLHECRGRHSPTVDSLQELKNVRAKGGMEVEAAAKGEEEEEEEESAEMYKDPSERGSMIGLECALNIIWQVVTVDKPRTWLIANGALDVVMSLLWAGGEGPNATPAWFSRPALAILATCSRLPQGRLRILHPLGPSPHLLQPAVSSEGSWEGESRRMRESMCRTSFGSRGCISLVSRDSVNISARSSFSSSRSDRDDSWYLSPMAIWDIIMEAALWPMYVAPPLPRTPPTRETDHDHIRGQRASVAGRVSAAGRASVAGRSAGLTVPANRHGRLSVASARSHHDPAYDEENKLEQPTADFAAEMLVNLLCHEEHARLMFVRMPGARELLTSMLRPPSRLPTRRAAAEVLGACAADDDLWRALHLLPKEKELMLTGRDVGAAKPCGQVLASTVVLVIQRAGIEYDHMRELDARAAAWTAEETANANILGKSARPLPARLRCELQDARAAVTAIAAPLWKGAQALAVVPDRTVLRGAMSVATLAFLLRFTVRLLHDHAVRLTSATAAELAELAVVDDDASSDVQCTKGKEGRESQSARRSIIHGEEEVDVGKLVFGVKQSSGLLDGANLLCAAAAAVAALCKASSTIERLMLIEADTEASRALVDGGKKKKGQSEKAKTGHASTVHESVYSKDGDPWDQPIDKWAGSHQLLLPAALHLLATHEAAPARLKEIVATAVAAVATHIQVPSKVECGGFRNGEGIVAASSKQTEDEETPFVPGDEDAPEGLYRAVLIKPPQVGGDNSGASLMDLIRNAALASKAGMLDEDKKDIRKKKIEVVDGNNDEKARKRNPAWLAKQISKAIRGESRWPWSEEELKGGVVWDGAVRAMARDAPFSVIYKEAQEMGNTNKPEFGIDLYLAIDNRHEQDVNKLSDAWHKAIDLCIMSGSSRAQQVTAIISGRFTEMGELDLAEKVIWDAAGRESEFRRGRARGRWKRAFVFARTEITHRRKIEAAARAPQGMITALIGAFEKDNDLGAAEVKASLLKRGGKMNRKMSAIHGHKHIGQPGVELIPASHVNVSASVSAPSFDSLPHKVSQSSFSLSSSQNPAAVSSTSESSEQHNANDTETAVERPQIQDREQPTSKSFSQLHVMSAAALMHLSLERSISWTTADIRQLLWSFAAAIKRLGPAAATAAPRSSGLTFEEKAKLREEHAALGTACCYLCEAVWSLAVMSPERLVPINGVSLVVNATRRLAGALVKATEEEHAKAGGGGPQSAAGMAALAAATKASTAARTRALRMLNVCVGALWEFATQESQEIKVSLGPGRGVVRLHPRAQLEAEAAQRSKQERRKEAGLVADAEEKGRAMAAGIDPWSKAEDNEVYLPDPDRIEEDEPALLVHALVEVMQMASKALAVKTPDGGYTAHGSDPKSAGPRQIALMTLRAVAARDMSTRISSCAASLGLGPTLVALALGDDPTLPPSQLGEKWGEAADGREGAKSDSIADAMAFGIPNGNSGLRRPGQLPKLIEETRIHEEKEEPKFGLDNNLAKQMAAKLEREKMRTTRLAEKSQRRHGRKDGEGRKAQSPAAIIAAATAAATAITTTAKSTSENLSPPGRISRSTKNLAPSPGTATVGVSDTLQKRKSCSLGAGNSEPPVAMPERHAAADLFLALAGRSRELVDAMGGGRGRQERMLVSIIATRDRDLEDLGARGIAHVTFSGDLPKRGVVEAGGVKELIGLVSRRELASPTQVIAMQALLNISSLRSAMPEIGKRCLKQLAELNALIVTAREDRESLRRRRCPRDGRGFDSDVTFDMLSTELQLCVGGVLANISKDKDNRTRLHKLELNLASEHIHLARRAAGAAKLETAATVGHRLETTDKSFESPAESVLSPFPVSSVHTDSSASSTDAGSPITSSTAAGWGRGLPPLQLASIPDEDNVHICERDNKESPLPIDPNLSYQQISGSHMKSAVTERAHRRLVQSVAESNNVNLDTISTQNSSQQHSGNGSPLIASQSLAVSAFASTTVPNALSEASGLSTGSAHAFEIDMLSQVVSPHVSAAVNNPPRTHQEHASYVWERAFSSVLNEVLPGVRHLMRSKPTRMLEITNPVEWARQEHAKSLLAAKAAAVVAAKEAEAHAEEMERSLKEMVAVKEAAMKEESGKSLSEKEKGEIEREVRKAHWKSATSKIQLLVKMRAGTGKEEARQETRIADSLGIAKRVAIGGGGLLLARPGQRFQDDDADDDANDGGNETRMSLASMLGGGNDAKDETEKEAEDAVAADLVAAAAAAAELCVVQADLAAAGSGTTWAPPLEEYVPRAPIGSTGVGGNNPVGTKQRVVYNVQLAPGGRRNCVKWMDEGEKLALERKEMQKKKLQAGRSKREVMSQAQGAAPLNLGPNIAFGGKHDFGEKGPPPAPPASLAANVTRWQASAQPGARVYDDMGLPAFEAPGEGGKRYYYFQAAKTIADECDVPLLPAPAPEAGIVAHLVGPRSSELCGALRQPMKQVVVVPPRRPELPVPPPPPPQSHHCNRDLDQLNG